MVRSPDGLWQILHTGGTDAGGRTVQVTCRATVAVVMTPGGLRLAGAVPGARRG